MTRALFAAKLADAAAPVVRAGFVASLPSGSSEEFKAVFADDTGVYVTGTTPAAFGGAAIMKFDFDGALVWSRRVSDNENTTAAGLGIAAGPSGDLYIVGTAVRWGGTYTVLFVMRMTKAGTPVWYRTYGPASISDTARADAVAVDASENIYVTGIFKESGTYGFLLKLDAAGTLLWQRRITETTELRSLCVDPSGDVVAVGAIPGDYSPRTKHVVLKHSAAGTLLWAKTLVSAASYESGWGVCADAGGNIYTVGAQESSRPAATLAKIASDGSLLWQKKYAPYGLGGAIVLRGGVLYIAGSEYESSTNSNNLLAFAVNTDGALLWSGRVRSTGSTSISSIGYGVALEPNNARVFIAARVGDPFEPYARLFALPADGSGAGTYGSLLYQTPASGAMAVSTLTYAASTLTSAAGTLTNSARTLNTSSMWDFYAFS